MILLTSSRKIGGTPTTPMMSTHPRYLHRLTATVRNKRCQPRPNIGSKIGKGQRLVRNKKAINGVNFWRRREVHWTSTRKTWKILQALKEMSRRKRLYFPCNYWYTRGEGAINTIKLSTGTVTIMCKPCKIDSSEVISGQNAANTTRGIHGNEKVYKTDTRGTIIHGIHRRIKGMLRMSVDGRYIGPGAHCGDTIMEPWSKRITDNTEKPKRHVINLRLIYGNITFGMDCTWRNEGATQTQTCGHVFKQYINSDMDEKMATKRSKAAGILLRVLALQQHACKNHLRQHSTYKESWIT